MTVDTGDLNWKEGRQFRGSPRLRSKGREGLTNQGKGIDRNGAFQAVGTAERHNKYRLSEVKVRILV